VPNQGIFWLTLKLPTTGSEKTGVSAAQARKSRTRARLVAPTTRSKGLKTIGWVCQDHRRRRLKISTPESSRN
jgi:hypothetical protein